MNLNYDEYEEPEFEKDMLFGTYEPIEPIEREAEVNSDLEGLGRQVLEK